MPAEGIPSLPGARPGVLICRKLSGSAFTARIQAKELRNLAPAQGDSEA